MPLYACLVLDEDGRRVALTDRSAGCGASPAGHDLRLPQVTATLMRPAGLSARAITDESGHARPFIWQNVIPYRKSQAPDANRSNRSQF
jgi:hypothetical protein